MPVMTDNRTDNSHDWCQSSLVPIVVLIPCIPLASSLGQTACKDHTKYLQYQTQSAIQLINSFCTD